MFDKVEYLISAIEKYENKQISGEELEEATGKILSSDDYESMNQEFRDKVELLDMWDVNNLTIEDLEVAKQVFLIWQRDN